MEPVVDSGVTDVRTWEPFETKIGKRPLSLSIKRLNFLEQKPFALVMARLELDLVFREVGRAHNDDEAYSRATLARLRAAVAEAGLEEAFEKGRTDLRERIKADGMDPAGADALDPQIVIAVGVLSQAGKEIPEPSSDEDQARKREIEEGRERQAKALERFFDSLPDGFVTKVFTEYVRVVGGLTIDGQAATTGSELLAVADQLLTVNVLKAIESFSTLSNAAKNGSSSLSMSKPAAQTDGGGSTVERVEREDGTAPATVTETQAAGL